MNLSLLYGSMTRKRMGGIRVTYARAPATFGARPEVAVPATVAAGCPEEGPIAPTGDPHDPQKVAPSLNAAPHFPQNAMFRSPLANSFLAGQQDLCAASVRPRSLPTRASLPEAIETCKGC